MLYHKRQHGRRRGGNQFYRDRGDTAARLTQCGAEPTPYDVSWRDKMSVWEHPEHGLMDPCPSCNN